MYVMMVGNVLWMTQEVATNVLWVGNQESPMGEVVQSVNIMIGILMGGVSWSIYYIMRMAYLEMNDERQNTTGSET